ncbi:SET domain-containing protein SmydA-8-like [Aphis gossypii]|uniref:SET domain-containing protein SmydA-8-like n=1 Tax=Aphis gossypii TaxID=80765 RepID=UPI002158E330|nr:SET domain-containing protein SmydA-8-like [Aphis gossypii]XP_050063439.1 SET domain-containing protein SmydA-8-like [Aphis gossypii]XP_050063440.1 SET domain-containing protein SmydA-8-like [Aphis gossypii]XP_050063441.1 SET domain-containing protein SmydA-8-like [Aphis gossypii]XP_050063442.1 SET domain-containing protein SmydA-8-like [Aphis gossypii]XP_050063443.1 SET domain-containing protein SmydA-8-like [Aphis gossypii]
MDDINDCVKKYLSQSGVKDYGGWTICAGSATVAGRGVVATRDYNAGDVIFVDVPLIVSPRAIGPDGTGSPVCPVCYAAVTTPIGCPGGCRWPVCGRQCADRPEHRDECRYVRQLRPKVTNKSDGQTWSVGIYNAITAVRGLSIRRGEYKYFLDVLQKKLTERPTFEVEELKRNISMQLDENDEQIMITTCKIMDANCFETIVNRYNKSISLKGLYPVASFMNHSCVPNTMHNFDVKLQMIVKASLPIYKGQEITTNYTNSIWPTSLRQHHLLTSKQFICTCSRCCDSEEFGTELAALNCIVKNCDGRILPINPLNKMSIWQCKICTKLVTSAEMICFYKDIETITKSISVFCPKSFEAILKSFNIHKNSPYVVDLRLKFIWKSKNNSLNLEQLLYKEKLCVEILDLVQKLRLGQCRLLGLISQEHQKVISEKAYRFRRKWNTKTLNVFEEQIRKLKEIYSSILDEDVNLNTNTIQ